MTSFSQGLREKFSIPSSGVEGLNLFQRYGILESLGMLAHEHNVGEPERPYSEWSREELDLALEVFQTWPKFEETEKQYAELADSFANRYAEMLSAAEAGVSRKDVILLASQALNKACKDVYGQDFPDVGISFEHYGERGIYGGLGPDDIININEDRLYEAGVNGSAFTGDASFVELMCHETVHWVQRQAVQKSDEKTQDGNLSALAAEGFYEATISARGKFYNLHHMHPFETEARDKANDMIAGVLKRIPALNQVRGASAQTDFTQDFEG